jgi:hypothetical protein
MLKLSLEGTKLLLESNCPAKLLLAKFRARLTTTRNITFKTEDVKLLCEQKFDERRGRE